MMKLVVCLVLGAIAATTTNGRVDLRRLDSVDGFTFDVEGGIGDVYGGVGVGGGRPESLLNPYTIEGSDPRNNHLRHDHY